MNELPFLAEVEDIDSGRRGIVLTYATKRVGLRRREGVWVFFYGATEPYFVPPADIRMVDRDPHWRRSWR